MSGYQQRRRHTPGGVHAQRGGRVRGRRVLLRQAHPRQPLQGARLRLEQDIHQKPQVFRNCRQTCRVRQYVSH